MAKLRQARSKGIKTHKRRGSYKSGGDPPGKILSNYASTLGQAEITQGERLSKQNPNLSKNLIDKGIKRVRAASNNIVELQTVNNGVRLDSPQPPSTPPPLNKINNQSLRSKLTPREIEKMQVLARENK